MSVSTSGSAKPLSRTPQTPSTGMAPTPTPTSRIVRQRDPTSIARRRCSRRELSNTSGQTKRCPPNACPYDAANYNPNNYDPIYLYGLNLAPGGTTIPQGVGVLGLGPIGMSITATIPETLDTSELAGGTFNGGGFSSATNWETKANSYQIQLYCTQDPNVTYASTNPVTS
jgi:hypothetical protein